jgi:hypothetical protein
MAAAISMLQARDLAREYLCSADEVRRAEILGALQMLETGETSQLARAWSFFTPKLDSLSRRSTSGAAASILGSGRLRGTRRDTGILWSPPAGASPTRFNTARRPKSS